MLLCNINQIPISSFFNLVFFLNAILLTKSLCSTGSCPRRQQPTPFDIDTRPGQLTPAVHTCACLSAVGAPARSLLPRLNGTRLSHGGLSGSRTRRLVTLQAEPGAGVERVAFFRSVMAFDRWSLEMDSYDQNSLCQGFLI